MSNYFSFEENYKGYRFIPKMNRRKIFTIFLLMISSILLNFYYKWICNLSSHIYRFFSVDSYSFLGILAMLFWGGIIIGSALYIGLKIVALLDENQVFENVSKDIIYKVTIGLCVIFFLLFSSSSRYFNRYIGLELDELQEGEFTYSGYEYLEYTQIKKNVPDEIQIEILEDLNMNLVNKEELKTVKKRVKIFNKYYENISFSKDGFIFEDTGVFQGFSSINKKEGFIQYVKCLLTSLIEIVYRGGSFFLIAILIIAPLLFLASLMSDKMLAYLGFTLVCGIVLLIIYNIGLYFFNWLKSLF